MSLVVRNAYRYPLAQQQAVHKAVMANCETVTKKLVDDAVQELLPHLSGHSPDAWLDVMHDLMDPKMPRKLSTRATRYYLNADKPGQFVRAFLHQYHRYTDAFPSTWPFVDTCVSWTYVWDSEHGYICLFLPSAVRAELLVSGLDEVVEPYGYDGRVGETDHPAEDPSNVAQTWDRVIGSGSPAYAGATACLSGYELSAVFGLV